MDCGVGVWNLTGSVALMGLVCCGVDLKSFLVDFDPSKADAMFGVLAGTDFGASTVDDLLLLDEKEWERLATPQALGKLPARRLRERLSKTIGAGSGGISITSTSGGITTIGAVGLNAKQIVKHYHGGKEQEIKPEPYDFTSIIDSKLSDINLESFGREWLYKQMYEWITTPPAVTQPKPPSILLVTGEPVRRTTPASMYWSIAHV